MHSKNHFRLAYLIGSTGWGGLEMNQINNAHWMQERGHSVLILCVKNSPSHQYLLKQRIPYELITKHRNHYAFVRAFSLWKILREYSIQHLILRSVSDMSIGASVRLLSKKKLHVHFFMEMQLKTKKTQWFRTIRYRCFSSWNCPLNYLKTQVIEQTKIPQERINVIPSAVRKEFFERKDIVTIRQLLVLPEKHYILGLFGRIDRKKNQLLALQAMQLLNLPDLYLLIVGRETPNDPQHYLEELKEYVVQKKLEGHVRFIDHVENVSDYFHAVNCCLITSEDESVGMVTLEALAAGKVVIGTNKGGTKEIVEHVCGRLISPENPASLAEAIREEKEILRGTFAVASHEQLSQNNIDYVCGKVEELLLRCS